MDHHTITYSEPSPAVAHVILNRPDARNALNQQMIKELTDCFQHIAQSNLRVVVLSAAGKHFCAGADLHDMKNSINASIEDNQASAQALADMLSLLDQLPQVTIAAVQGACMGGALGIALCCDFMIGQEDAIFCLSEVKLGLIPAVISPYVIRAFGSHVARKMMLSAKTINAQQANELHVVDSIASDNVAVCALQHATDFLQLAPNAIAACKQLIQAVDQRPIDAELKQYTSQQIANIRVQSEAQTGLKAFFDLAQPPWVITDKGASND